jgi:hypothetical protein
MFVRVMIYLPDPLAHSFWRICELAASPFPEYEDGDGFRNVGVLALQTPDAAASPRAFYRIQSP